MKRAKKSRRHQRPPQVAVKPAEDRLVCNQSLVVMGNSYGSPPTHWLTYAKSCQACSSGFVVTAAEQRFWHEELRIPYVVNIAYCQSCRRSLRAHRRLVIRLGELIPRIDAGLADVREEREAVLVIAEGTVRHPPARLGSHRHPNERIFSGTKVIGRGVALADRLIKRSSRNQD